MTQSNQLKNIILHAERYSGDLNPQQNRTHIIPLELGQGVQDGLDSPEGRVVRACLPHVVRVFLEERVDIQQHLAQVHLSHVGGQQSNFLPQTLTAINTICTVVIEGTFSCMPHIKLVLSKT